MAEKSDGEASITEYPRNTGRAYRNQAMALIGICRFFSRFSTQGQDQDAEFKTVLRTCDDVLRFAVYSGQKTTHKTNKWFESATQTLGTYASTFHPGIDVVRARMGVAKKMDLMVYQNLGSPDLMVVNFVLFKTLPDPDPVVVRLMLSPTAGIEEVLWQFAHFEDNRRITLQDNPHFYSELPTSPDAYTSHFKAHPIEYFVLRPNDTIYVLVDQPRRVFLDTRRETRTFGNVFTLKDVMIFKDVHGVLEGESVVGESILDVPNLWRNEKFFVIPDSNTLAYDLRLHPIITATPTAKRSFRDRRDLLRGALDSSYNDLYIYVGQLPPLWIPRKKGLLPSAPTSERPGWCDLLYTTFDALNSNILLAIFDYCRLDDEESWNIKLRWCKLSQVCQKWRHVIHRSSLHLDMHIPFTNGTPSLDMLSHLPPLPIDIDFRSRNTVETGACVLRAIQKRARIRRIVLKVPAPTLEKLIATMNKRFPQLEYLSLSSTTRPKEGTKLMVPRTFLAPNLCHLELPGIYLPTGLPLLTFTHALVTLKLSDIKAPGYFTPDDLVTQLRHIPQVEDVSIGFSTPIPRPNAEGELLLPPIALTKLPALRRLDFRGVGTYLESLLPRISAPLLERFNITLFNQLTFTLPHLSHFTDATERLRHPSATIIFNPGAVSFVVGSGEQPGKEPFSLRINCKHFDWQVHCATQVCGALEPVLSFAETVTLEVEEQSLPPDWQNDIDGVAWHDLLGPFSNVKKLCIGYPLASKLFTAMESENAKLVLGLLPELQELEVKLGVAHADTAFAALVNARRLANRPVRMSVIGGLPALQKEPSPPWEQEKVLVPSAPTSVRPGYDIQRTIIYLLNDNILFTIFDYCRMDDEESWNLKLRWCELSHVCRKWRQIIHQSFFRLDIHIPFANGTLPSDVLSHLPPLPIVVDHRSRDAGGADAGVLHAMQQSDCAHCTDLQTPSPTLDEWTVPTDEPLSKLEYPSLSSTTTPKNDTKLMVPGTFPAPNLRHRKSRATCLLKALPVLASSIPLVALKLTDIRTSGYFAPEELVIQLQQLPQLEELSIGFSIPLPRPHAEGKLLLPPTPPTTLPALRRLEFQGVGAYLESLIAQISAPLLERFNITLFNQLTFSLQHLSYLVKTTEALKHPFAKVTFNSEGVSFVGGPRAELSDGSFGLQVRCKRFDWQMNAATQICAALAPVLSVAEEVMLEFDGPPSPDWRNAVDGKAWRELLGPFTSAKRVRIVCPRAPEFSASLESYLAELAPGLGQLSALRRQHLDAQVETERSKNTSASATSTDSRTTLSSDLPVQSHLPLTHHVQCSDSTESFEVIGEDDYSPDPDPDPAPAKKNWFRRNVVGRVWKGLGSRVRAGRSCVVRLVSSPFK